MKVRLLCEGNWDGRIDRRGQCEGAAVILLKRLTDNQHHVTPGRLPSLTKGGGLKRKMELAIHEADTDPNCDALVVLVDRDKPEYNSRLTHMEDGIESCRGKAIASRTVAGMAVEELEAWLIASSKPLGDAHLSVSASSKPEEQSDPKSLFHEMLRQAQVAFADGYDLAARVLDFDEVESKCKAFARFAKAVRARIK